MNEMRELSDAELDIVAGGGLWNSVLKVVGCVVGGATIGSTFPGPGTVIGACAGLVLGGVALITDDSAQ